MSAPTMFRSGTQVAIKSVTGEIYVATLIHWKTDGVLVETEDAYHFAPFTTIAGITMDKPPVAAGNYTSDSPYAFKEN